MANPIVCSKCGKQYAWKAELAGKTVRCACGQSMQVAAVPVTVPEDDLLDLAPEPAAAPAKPAVNREALNEVIRTRMGVMPGKTSETKERERLEAHRQEMEARTRPNAVRDIIVPVGLIAVGIMLLYVEARLGKGGSQQSFTSMTVGVLTNSVLSVGLLSLGMLAARAMMDVTFIYPLKDSALRFIAIGVGPCAIYGICTAWLGDLGGPAAGAFLSLVVYALLFPALLKLDIRDTSICVLTTWIMVAMAKYIAFRFDAYRLGTPFGI